MDRKFWAIIGIIVVVFVGFLIFGGKDDKQPSGQTGKASNHILGKADSKVKLVEYGDFQCPTCRDFHPVIKQVVDKYKNDISFQFRNLPLTQIHNHAYAAARAAEAADKQEKYWEMHDILFENQISWSKSDKTAEYFGQYAKQIGLNVEQFKIDAASSEVNSIINGDLAAFKDTKQQQATPTFFLNGKKIELQNLRDQQGIPSLEKFSKLIDAEIAKNQ